MQYLKNFFIYQNFKKDAKYQIFKPKSSDKNLEMFDKLVLI